MINARRAAILGIGSIWVLALRLTTSSPTGDFFDSPLFPWSFAVLPAVAWLGVRTRLETSPLAWGLMVVPAAVWVFIAGFLLFDPANGASLWIAGEMSVAMLAGLVIGGAALAFPRPGPRTPPWSKLRRRKEWRGDN